jgi:transcriptional regulator with XRE-family HTH domain
MQESFRELAAEFSNREYAHGYMESHAVSRIAAQVHALRRQRGWSQEELSKRSGIAQERISKIESADFSSLTMSTLQKLSRAFDVHLHISFVPFSAGIIDIGNLHTEQLQVPSRMIDLETAFTDGNEDATEITAYTAITEPRVIVRILSREAGKNIWDFSPTLPHKLTTDVPRRFSIANPIKKAQTNGGALWPK